MPGKAKAWKTQGGARLMEGRVAFNSSFNNYKVWSSEIEEDQGHYSKSHQMTTVLVKY